MNAVHEASRYMSKTTQAHMLAMLCIMKYCALTPDHGLTLKPKGTFDGREEFDFEITDFGNSEYAKDKSWHSVNKWIMFL